MTRQDQDLWLDEEAGPIVRPYAMTQGRTRPGNPELNMITMVSAVRVPTGGTVRTAEHDDVLQICQQPTSVAEVASHLDVPVLVVKVLISDLVDRGDVVIRPPIHVTESPDTNTLRAVLEGIRRL